MIQLGKNEFKFSDERYPNLVFLRHSKAAKTKINELGTKRLLKELDSAISDFIKKCPEGAIRLQKYIWGKGDVLKYPLQVKKNGVKVILDKYILGLPTSRVDSGKGEKLTLKTIPSFDRYIKLMDNLEGKDTDIHSFIDRVNIELLNEDQENILEIDLEKYEPYYKNIDYLALDYQMSQRYRSHLSELKRQVGFRKAYCDHTFIITVDKLHCNYKCTKCRILISQDLGGNFISPLKTEKSLLKLCQNLDEMIKSMDYSNTEWKQIVIMYQKYIKEKERLDLKRSVRELDDALFTLASYMKKERIENRYSFLYLKDFEFEILESEKWYLSHAFASLEKYFNANQGFVEFICHWFENMDELARELEMELKDVKRRIEEIEESCSIAYSISVGNIPMFGREVKTVLAAVKKLEGKFGKTRISELLYGSKGKESEKHKLNEYDDYGKLKHLGKAFISTGIKRLVNENLISSESSAISKRLLLTSKGERLLRILEKDKNDETINSLSFGDFVKLCLQGKVREKERKDYISFKIMRDDIVFYKVLVQYLKTNEDTIQIFEDDLLSCTTERYLPILDFYEKWEEESGFKEMIKRIKGERIRNVN